MTQENRGQLAGKNVTVYCSSSIAVAPLYFEAARELGAILAQAGATLVYGGTNVGLMGAISQAVRAGGGRTIGVIPERIQLLGITDTEVSELVVTDGMRERKAVMEDRADAFVALPGGFGTFEEFFEIVTAKQLGLHRKPIVLLNIAGYYDPLLQQLEKGAEQEFIKANGLLLFNVSTTPQAALDYIADYQPPSFQSKWFDLPGGFNANRVTAANKVKGEVPGSE